MGPLVHNPRQAIAIALNEVRKTKKTLKKIVNKYDNQLFSFT
jgi:hypothetical protein